MAHGIGTHAPSVIEYDLPPGYETFKATGVLDPGSRGRGSVPFAVYSEKAVVPVKEVATVAVSSADRGITGPVRVRDLWAQSRKDRIVRDAVSHFQRTLHLV